MAGDGVSTAQSTATMGLGKPSRWKTRTAFSRMACFSARRGATFTPPSVIPTMRRGGAVGCSLTITSERMRPVRRPWSRSSTARSRSPVGSRPLSSREASPARTRSTASEAARRSSVSWTISWWEGSSSSFQSMSTSRLPVADEQAAGDPAPPRLHHRAERGLALGRRDGDHAGAQRAGAEDELVEGMDRIHRPGICHGRPRPASPCRRDPEKGESPTHFPEEAGSIVETVCDEGARSRAVER